MHYVYILKSISHPTQSYVGYTANLKERLTRHNQARCLHTAKYIPWELKWYGAFPEKQDALEFETYLKSHSGKAFTLKRLVKENDSKSGLIQELPPRPPHPKSRIQTKNGPN